VNKSGDEAYRELAFFAGKSVPAMQPPMTAKAAETLTE
jgi:hypothetical protein